jgi:hypothetical protein
MGLNIKSFDIAEDLKPDYLGDVIDIKKIVNKKFDIVCCFETLEHIRFEHLPTILTQLSAITDDYLIISVPQIRLYFTAWFNIPRFKPFQIKIDLPFPKRHHFDGEHFWELGKRNYSRKSFRNLLQRNFNLESEFTHALHPYHRFFVLRPKK